MEQSQDSGVVRKFGSGEVIRKTHSAKSILRCIFLLLESILFWDIVLGSNYFTEPPLQYSQLAGESALPAWVTLVTADTPLQLCLYL